MKKYLFVIFCFILTISYIFPQEKIKYGNIPYGMSIEKVIETYSTLYDGIYQSDLSINSVCL